MQAATDPRSSAESVPARTSIRPSPNLRSSVGHIRPAVEALLETGLAHERHARVRQAVRTDIRMSSKQLPHGSDVLEKVIGQDRLLVVGPEYSLETGVIEFFES